jgi:hypothetical protein
MAGEQGQGADASFLDRKTHTLAALKGRGKYGGFSGSSPSPWGGQR